MDFTEEIWLKIGYVLRSKRKANILRLLKENTKTPSEISTELDIGRGSVYTLINELVDIDVIACVDEEQKRNKRYAATPLGVDIITSIDSRDVEGLNG